MPNDYLKFAHLAADLRRDLDEAKSRLEVTQAKLGQQIRSKPEEYGLEKVTEAGVSGVILTLGKYQEASQEVIKVRHELEIAQAAVSALEVKKRSLTLLVELHGSSYFASPKLSSAGREAVDDMTKRRVRTRRDEREERE